MNVFDKLKELSLVSHIANRLGQQPKRVGNKQFFKAHKDDKNPSLCVYHDNNYKDFSETLGGGTIIDFEKYFSLVHLNEDLSNNQIVQRLAEEYGIPRDQIEFVKSPKRKDIIDNFEDYRMQGVTGGLARFLSVRGVDYDDMQEFDKTLEELSKELGFVNNVWIKDDIYKDSIVFPCLDGKGKLIGGKLRTTDGTPFDYKGAEVKSPTIYSTGVIFKEGHLSDEEIILVEGEADYLILKMLGFHSVIGNLGGVSAGADYIKKLTKKCQRLVCFYDNDDAGIAAIGRLEEKLGRPVHRIKFPKIDGRDKFDINDLYKIGYDRSDFGQLIKEAYLPSECLEGSAADVKGSQPLYKDRIFYNEEEMAYFDVQSFKFKQPADLARHYNMKPNDLEDRRVAKIIPSYKGVCYWDGGREGHYNLLSKESILKPSDKPIFPEEFKMLIENLCNYKKENIEWLLKAIAYKYTHLNDALIPAVVFHGIGGSGKGLFMKLLGQIFGEDNTMIGLSQEAIDSQYSSYSGQKLIVEFKEIGVESASKGKKNMNKLKTFIMEDKIMVRKLYQNPIPVDNIAWFIMSSNEAMPVYLDSKGAGNRRFTIIKTGGKIPRFPYGNKIKQKIDDKDAVRNFLAYLLETYPEVNDEGIAALENEDKKVLENLTASAGDLFFEWFEEKYPHINKISVHERNYYLDMYRVEMGEDNFLNDPKRYYPTNFNKGLSPRYTYTTVRVRGKTGKGYLIDKNVDGDGFFEEEKTFGETEIPVKHKAPFSK